MGRYAGGVEETDRGVGLLLDALEEAGVREGTVAAFLADHGERFLEHQALVHAGEAFYNQVLHVQSLAGGRRAENFVVASGGKTANIITADRSCIRPTRKGEPRRELYFLREDPEEIRNLARDWPARAAELRSLLTAKLRSSLAHEYAVGGEEVPAAAMSEEMRERLCALGYVD